MTDFRYLDSQLPSKETLTFSRENIDARAAIATKEMSDYSKAALDFIAKATGSEHQCIIGKEGICDGARTHVRSFGSFNESMLSELTRMFTPAAEVSRGKGRGK